LRVNRHNKETNKETNNCCIGDETQQKGLVFTHHESWCRGRKTAGFKQKGHAHGPPPPSPPLPLIPDHWLPHSSILSTPP
jgi:hypothetical protein